MKTAIFSLFAIVASAIATPLVAERQLESQGNQLDTLMTRIQGYTAAISAYLSILSNSTSHSSFFRLHLPISSGRALRLSPIEPIITNLSYCK